MQHVSIFLYAKNFFGSKFVISTNNIGAARSLLTTPFGILKKILRNATCETFGVRNFSKKLKNFFFLKMLIIVLNYHTIEKKTTGKRN